MIALNVWIYLLYFLAAAMGYCIFWAFHWGRSYKRHHRHPDWLEEHISYVRWASIFLVASIIHLAISETFVFSTHRLSPFSSQLGKIHISCALLFGSLFFLAKFKVTGIVYPRAHKFVVYPCVICGAVILITGFYLLAPFLRH